MEVKVRFFTSLRELVGKREEILSYPNDDIVTVGTVLKTLSSTYGKDFTDYVCDAKTMQPKNFLQFLVNGISTTTLDGLETKLEDNSVLAILPPVGGG